MATSEFGKAFAAARKGGQSSFEFNGKKYHTRTAEDDGAAKKSASDAAQRGRSDMMKALTAAERNAPAETSPLARQKIAESKARVTREYAAAGEGTPKATGATIQSMDTDVMRTNSRTAAKAAGAARQASVKTAQKATPYKMGGMVKGKC